MPILFCALQSTGESGWYQWTSLMLIRELGGWQRRAHLGTIIGDVYFAGAPAPLSHSLIERMPFGSMCRFVPRTPAIFAAAGIRP